MILHTENAGLLLYALEDTPGPLEQPRTLREAGSYTAYAANERTLVIGTTGGQVFSLSLEEGKEEEGEVMKEDQKITSVAVSPDGALMAWGTDEGMMKLYKTGEQRVVGEVEIAEETDVARLIISQENKHLLALPGDEGDVMRWDVEQLEAGDTKPVIKYLNSTQERINRMLLTSENRCLLTLSEQGNLRVWDFEHGKLLTTFSTEGEGGVAPCAAMSPDRAYAVTGRGM